MHQILFPRLFAASKPTQTSTLRAIVSRETPNDFGDKKMNPTLPERE
jgi:hypothetical protein